MNLLFAINESFLPGLLTAIVSVCVNNPGHHRIFVMYDELKKSSKQKATKVFRRFDAEVSFVNIGTGAFSSERYTTLPRYYSQSINRLLPHLALPKDVDRVLYLDADLVVNGSLQKFYSTEFDGNFLVAPSVRRDGKSTGPFADQESGVYDLLKIPLQSNDLYFNSGVLLMNVSLFRSLDVAFYDAIVNRYHDEIMFADQDILNLAFKDRTIKVVDRRLNCTIPDNMRLRKGEYRWIRDEVVVLHYVVWRKPWMPFRYRNRIFHIYMKYLRVQGPCFKWASHYLIWYFMKPVHFLVHCWRKAISLLFCRRSER